MQVSCSSVIMVRIYIGVSIKLMLKPDAAHLLLTPFHRTANCNLQLLEAS